MAHDGQVHGFLRNITATVVRTRNTGLDSLLQLLERQLPSPSEPIPARDDGQEALSHLQLSDATWKALLQGLFSCASTDKAAFQRTAAPGAVATRLEKCARALRLVVEHGLWRLDLSLIQSVLHHIVRTLTYHHRRGQKTRIKEDLGGSGSHRSSEKIQFGLVQPLALKYISTLLLLLSRPSITERLAEQDASGWKVSVRFCVDILEQYVASEDDSFSSSYGTSGVFSSQSSGYPMSGTFSGSQVPMMMRPNMKDASKLAILGDVTEALRRLVEPTHAPLCNEHEAPSLSSIARKAYRMTHSHQSADRDSDHDETLDVKAESEEEPPSDDEEDEDSEVCSYGLRIVDVLCRVLQLPNTPLHRIPQDALATLSTILSVLQVERSHDAARCILGPLVVQESIQRAQRDDEYRWGFGSAPGMETPSEGELSHQQMVRGARLAKVVCQWWSMMQRRRQRASKDESIQRLRDELLTTMLTMQPALAMFCGGDGNNTSSHLRGSSDPQRIARPGFTSTCDEALQKDVQELVDVLWHEFLSPETLEPSSSLHISSQARSRSRQSMGPPASHPNSSNNNNNNNSHRHRSGRGLSQMDYLDLSRDMLQMDDISIYMPSYTSSPKSPPPSVSSQFETNVFHLHPKSEAGERAWVLLQTLSGLEMILFHCQRQAQHSSMKPAVLEEDDESRHDSMTGTPPEQVRGASKRRARTSASQSTSRKRRRVEEEDWMATTSVSSTSHRLLDRFQTRLQEDGASRLAMLQLLPFLVSPFPWRVNDDMMMTLLYGSSDGVRSTEGDVSSGANGLLSSVVELVQDRRGLVASWAMVTLASLVHAAVATTPQRAAMRTPFPPILAQALTNLWPTLLRHTTMPTTCRAVCLLLSEVLGLLLYTDINSWLSDEEKAEKTGFHQPLLSPSVISSLDTILSPAVDIHGPSLLMDTSLLFMLRLLQLRSRQVPRSSLVMRQSVVRWLFLRWHPSEVYRQYTTLQRKSGGFVQSLGRVATAGDGHGHGGSSRRRGSRQTKNTVVGSRDAVGQTSALMMIMAHVREDDLRMVLLSCIYDEFPERDVSDGIRYLCDSGSCNFYHHENLIASEGRLPDFGTDSEGDSLGVVGGGGTLLAVWRRQWATVTMLRYLSLLPSVCICSADRSRGRYGGYLKPNLGRFTPSGSGRGDNDTILQLILELCLAKLEEAGQVCEAWSQTTTAQANTNDANGGSLRITVEGVRGLYQFLVLVPRVLESIARSWFNTFDLSSASSRKLPRKTAILWKQVVRSWKFTHKMFALGVRTVDLSTSGRDGLVEAVMDELTSTMAYHFGEKEGRLHLFDIICQVTGICPMNNIITTEDDDAKDDDEDGDPEDDPGSMNHPIMVLLLGAYSLLDARKGVRDKFTMEKLPLFEEFMTSIRTHLQPTALPHPLEPTKSLLQSHNQRCDVLLTESLVEAGYYPSSVYCDQLPRQESFLCAFGNIHLVETIRRLELCILLLQNTVHYADKCVSTVDGSDMDILRRNSNALNHGNTMDEKKSKYGVVEAVMESLMQFLQTSSDGEEFLATRAVLGEAINFFLDVFPEPAIMSTSTHHQSLWLLSLGWAQRIVEKIGRLLGQGEWAGSEVMLVTVIQLLRRLQPIWIVAFTATSSPDESTSSSGMVADREKELADLVGDVFEFLSFQALDSNMLSTASQIALSKLLLNIFQTDASFAETMTNTPCHDLLLRLVQPTSATVNLDEPAQGDASPKETVGRRAVQFAVVPAILSFFTQQNLLEHEKFFVHVLTSLPANAGDLEAMAFRLYVLGALARRWPTLLRRCVYYLFEAAGEVHATEAHVQRCLAAVAAHLGLADARELFQLFARQLLVVWFDPVGRTHESLGGRARDKEEAQEEGAQEGRSIYDIPFGIFGFQALRELLVYAQEEVAALLLMRWQEHTWQAFLSTLGVEEAQVVVKKCFGRIMAYVIANEVALQATIKRQRKKAQSSTSLDPGDMGGTLPVNRAQMAEAYLQETLGARAFKYCVHASMAEIIAIMMELVYQEQDDHMAMESFHGPLAYAGENLTLIKSLGSSNSHMVLPANQEPIFKGRQFIHQLEHLCGLTRKMKTCFLPQLSGRKDTAAKATTETEAEVETSEKESKEDGRREQLWSPPLVVYIVRHLLSTVQIQALGSLHACSVLRKLRIVVSLAGPTVLSGYPLQMLLHALQHPFLLDPMCSEDAVGITRYLLTRGQPYLRRVPPFIAGYGVSTLVLLAGRTLAVEADKNAEDGDTEAKSTEEYALRSITHFRQWLGEEYLANYDSDLFYATSLSKKSSSEKETSGEAVAERVALEQKKAFRRMVQAASRMKSRQGSARKGTPGSRLLYTILHDDATHPEAVSLPALGLQDRLLSPNARDVILRLLCEGDDEGNGSPHGTNSIDRLHSNSNPDATKSTGDNNRRDGTSSYRDRFPEDSDRGRFEMPLSVRDDIIDSDRYAVSLGASVWRSCQRLMMMHVLDSDPSWAINGSDDIPNRYLAWAGRVLGRLFSATGDVPQFASTSGESSKTTGSDGDPGSVSFIRETLLTTDYLPIALGRTKTSERAVLTLLERLMEQAGGLIPAGKAPIDGKSAVGKNSTNSSVMVAGLAEAALRSIISGGCLALTSGGEMLRKVDEQVSTQSSQSKTASQSKSASQTAAQSKTVAQNGLRQRQTQIVSLFTAHETLAYVVQKTLSQPVYHALLWDIQLLPMKEMTSFYLSGFYDSQSDPLAYPTDHCSSLGYTREHGTDVLSGDIGGCASIPILHAKSIYEPDWIPRLCLFLVDSILPNNVESPEDGKLRVQGGPAASLLAPLKPILANVQAFAKDVFPFILHLVLVTHRDLASAPKKASKKNQTVDDDREDDSDDDDDEYEYLTSMHTALDDRRGGARDEGRSFPVGKAFRRVLSKAMTQWLDEFITPKVDTFSSANSSTIDVKPTLEASSDPRIRQRIRLLLNALIFLRTQSPSATSNSPSSTSSTSQCVTEKYRWLALDGFRTAAAASRLGMPKTALQLWETSEHQVAPSPTRPSQPVSQPHAILSRRNNDVGNSDVGDGHDEDSDNPGTKSTRQDQLLLEIYQNLDDPDAYYGLSHGASLDSFLQSLEHDGDGTKMLAFHGAAYDASLAISSSSTSTIPPQAGTGVIKSLNRLGLSGLSQSLLQQTQPTEGQPTQDQNQFHADWLTDTTYTTAQRLRQWDLPTPCFPAPFHPSSSSSTTPSKGDSTSVLLYGTFQRLTLASDSGSVQKAIRSSLQYVMARLATESYRNMNDVRSQLGCLAALTELDDAVHSLLILDHNNSDSEKSEDNMLASQDDTDHQDDSLTRMFRQRSRHWMRRGRYSAVSSLLSSRETTLSLLSQSPLASILHQHVAQDQAYQHATAPNLVDVVRKCKVAEFRNLILASQVFRFHNATQESLRLATMLARLAPTATRELGLRFDAAVNMELAHAFWDQGEHTSSIRILQSLLDSSQSAKTLSTVSMDDAPNPLSSQATRRRTTRSQLVSASQSATVATSFLQTSFAQLPTQTPSKAPPLESQDIPVSRATVLSTLGTRIATARLEHPRDILKRYLEPALRELSGRSCGNEAGHVYHHFAVFCDQQLENPESLEDLQRLRDLCRAKEDDVQELKRLLQEATDRATRSSNPATVAAATKNQGVYQQHLNRAKKQLQTDRSELERIEESHAEFGRLCLENYLLSLIASDTHNRDALRFTALWLQRIDDDILAQQAVQRHLQDVPTRKFAGLMNQLTSRLQLDNETSHGEAASSSSALFQRLLIELVVGICVDHPYHGMYHIWSATCSKETHLKQDDVAVSRQHAAIHIAKRLESYASSSSSAPPTTNDVAYIWKCIDRTSRLYDFLASDQDKSLYREGKKLALKSTASGRKFLAGLIHYSIPPPTLTIPLSASKNYQDVPRTANLEPDMTIAGGISRPKIITAIGTDGLSYRQLVKGSSDDLRQDAIMEQVFAAVSSLLHFHRATQLRNLGIRTYKVLPLTATSGVIEFVPHTTSLSGFLLPAHARYHPEDWPYTKCREVIDAVHDKSSDERLRAFLRVCDHYRPVMRYFFLETFVDPDDWFHKRLAYTRSSAAISILGHVLGLGDRHGQNILLDTKTGEAVHIDLGAAFEAGRLLRIPEVVPFRLSRDLVDGMGSTGVEGVFRRCCEFTLQALREEVYEIMTILDVLRYDPLYSWSMSPVRLSRMQAAAAHTTTNNLANGGDPLAAARGQQQHPPTRGPPPPGKGQKIHESPEALRALAVVRRKLANTLSVQAVVRDLVQQATDPRNLALLYHGWGAFM